MNAALLDGLRDHHLESQLQLVGEHWSSVRRLWLGTSLPPGELLGGLPGDFWTGCGMPGIANIKPDLAGRFEFAEEGPHAFIFPAYNTIPGLVVGCAEHHVEELRDLVAVDVDAPDRFWRRRGEALVLGNAYLEIAGQECEPITVFKTPMSWLRSGGAGIVVLDWDYARDLLLDHEIIAEGLELGAALENALRPEIFIKEIVA